MQPLTGLSHRHPSDRRFFWHKITVELKSKIYFCFPIPCIAYNDKTLGHGSTIFSGKRLLRVTCFQFYHRIISVSATLLYKLAEQKHYGFYCRLTLEYISDYAQCSQLFCSKPNSDIVAQMHHVTLPAIKSQGWRE